jgi:hypothetical protein
LLHQDEGCETSNCIIARVGRKIARNAVQAQSGPFRPAGSSYRLFLGEHGKVSAFSGGNRDTFRSLLKNGTAVSTESVAFQLQNLHKRDNVCDSPYLSKNKTQNNEIYYSRSISYSPIFSLRYLTTLSVAMII